MTTEKMLANDLTDRFWSTLENRIRKEEEMQPVLYHYTGLDSFMGMIESNNLWMSKGTFLNDSNELIYITAIVKNIRAEMKEQIREGFRDKEEAELAERMFLEQLDHTLSRFQSDIDLDEFEVYILSLTENKDSLALWYNYSKGDGYSIGFSSEEMLKRINEFSRKTQNQHNLVYGHVIYDRKKQENILMDFFMETIGFIFQSKNRLSEEDINNLLSDHLFTIIAVCSIFFKNEAFRSEEEYRIAFPRIIAPEIKNENMPVMFRAQNGVIIPFISVDFQPRLPVSHVTIGPKNNINVAKAGIEHYLKSKGYNWEEITISKSVAELRY